MLIMGLKLHGVEGNVYDVASERLTSITNVSMSPVYATVSTLAATSATSSRPGGFTNARARRRALAGQKPRPCWMKLVGAGHPLGRVTSSRRRSP